MADTPEIQALQTTMGEDVIPKIDAIFCALFPGSSVWISCLLSPRISTLPFVVLKTKTTLGLEMSI